MEFYFNNKRICLTDQWHYFYNGRFVENIPQSFNYIDDFLAARFVPETSYYIGFRKHISWDDCVIDASFGYEDGILDNISNTYNKVYDHPIYPCEDLEKARIQLDKFLLKFNDLKVFI